MTSDSPRLRRLRSDLKAMQQLRSESTIFSFQTPGETYAGGPETYLIRFAGVGLWRPEGSVEVLPRFDHEVRIHLSASYPRMMPDLSWKTPIFHPNVSSSGVVCLGGYGTHWAPSLQLDELTHMLWEMVRYANFDVKSPYNREAAYWARSQNQFRLPVDPRSLRDRVVTGTTVGAGDPLNSRSQPVGSTKPPDIVFLDTNRIASRHSAEIIDAELVSPPDSEILFID